MKKTASIILTTVCIILATVMLVSNWEKLIQKDVEKPGPVHKADKKTPTIREKKIYEIKGEIAPPAEGSKAPAVASRAVTVERNYNEIHREVINFFHYLDHKDYIKAYRLKEGTYKHFLILIEKLSANPPTVSGETQDIYILTHNIAHFYRVIGEKDISLIKDILSNEKEKLEQVTGIFYEWITGDQKKEVKAKTKDLYEYAAFFLNTMGGRAYLSRRDSRTRIFVTYYSILILNKANEEILNRHGVDIRPHLTLLLEDINNQRILTRKTEYLKKLNAIKKNLIP